MCCYITIKYASYTGRWWRISARAQGHPYTHSSTSNYSLPLVHRPKGVLLILTIWCIGHSTFRKFAKKTCLHKPTLGESKTQLFWKTKTTVFFSTKKTAWETLQKLCKSRKKCFWTTLLYLLSGTLPRKHIILNLDDILEKLNTIRRKRIARSLLRGIFCTPLEFQNGVKSAVLGAECLSGLRGLRGNEKQIAKVLCLAQRWVIPEQCSP